jgi:chromosome segregation ATPase
MDWQTFGFFASVLAAWSALLVQLQKAQLDRLGSHLDKRLDDIKRDQDKHAAENTAIKDDLARLKAELARDYLRREDWVRQVSVLDGKVDNWTSALDRKFEDVRKYIYDRRT